MLYDGEAKSEMYNSSLLPSFTGDDLVGCCWFFVARFDGDSVPKLKSASEQ